MKKIVFTVAAAALALFAFAWGGGARVDWHSASRDSAGFAPLPTDEPGAVIQAYAAALWGWRGLFADHTWIAAKARGADSYTVYEVIGWRLPYAGTALRVARDVPDRHWFGARPKLLVDVRGTGADALVKKLDTAVRRYPWADRYKKFPGPNSNTFTAWVAREVPELGLRLPLRAIGKGYVNCVN